MIKLFIIKGQKSHKSRSFFNVLVETSETWVTAVQRNHGCRPQIPSDNILCPLISRKLGFVKLVHFKWFLSVARSHLEVSKEWQFRRLKIAQDNCN